MAIQFKLTKADGLTRRITFVTLPTWSLLSARIANLYDIVIENVGVSYIDSDGDEVTLSSDDELQDFYTSVPVRGDGVVKLAVHDLSSLRAANPIPRSLPRTAPQQSNFRNTFGGHEVLPLVFDAEDEWQPLPGSLGSLFLSRDAPESPHAFVEVLESDVSLTKSEAVESRGGDTSRSDLTFTPAALQNRGKGKGRAVTIEDDISSADSVIGNEAPAKPPVHVFDVNSEDVSMLSSKPTVQPPGNGAATPAQAQSTPVIIEQSLEADLPISAGEQKTEVLDDDPPVPSLNLSDSDRVPPSLVEDIATLLTTISTVVGTHPELSESLRNIVINSTNGTYWAAHRNAISRAAENIHRTALQETGRSIEELRRVTEREAGVRVTEALGTIFRTFAQDGQNTGSQAFGNTTQVSPDETTSDIPQRPPSVLPTLPRFPRPPHPHRNRHSWFGQTPFTHPGGPFWGGLAHTPPFPPPPPPPPPPVPPRGWPRPPPSCLWGRYSEQPESAVNTHDARVTATEALTTAAEIQANAAAERAQMTDAQMSPTPKLTPEELRAEVERAKADYKARKDRYREAKAMKKMSEQRYNNQASPTESISRQVSDNPTQVTSNDNGPTATLTPTAEHLAPEPTTADSEIHIVSNARGPYPQLEMFSVPRRSHTTGHMHMYRGQVHESKENRPFNRIMRKLSDMGFTEGTYPNLTGKVRDQLLVHPPVTKDAEEDIVTNLIEELIPSGGGAHVGVSGGIPGAWH